MEDLIHEAKSTGFRIPPGDIEKYKDIGLKVVKAKSPSVRTSSRGRKLKDTERSSTQISAGVKSKKVATCIVELTIMCTSSVVIPLSLFDLEKESGGRPYF